MQAEDIKKALFTAPFGKISGNLLQSQSVKLVSKLL